MKINCQNHENNAKSYVKSIITLHKNNELNCSINTLLNSILHMHNNRMFKAYGREHEFVMYDFLRRVYFSNKINR